MSGPRDLRRGAKPYERQIDPREAIGRKSYYSIEAWGSGWAISVHRRGAPVETILCATPGELNRHRQRLTDAGLIGWNGRAA